MLKHLIDMEFDSPFFHRSKHDKTVRSSCFDVYVTARDFALSRKNAGYIVVWGSFKGLHKVMWW